MDAVETISQWLGYSALLAKYLPDAEIVQLDGVAVRWLNVRWPSMNACIVNTAVADIADLERRVMTATEFAARRNRKWVLTACDELLPAAVCAGLGAASGGVGMLSDCLLPSVKPAPRLEYRPVDGIASRRIMADLNSQVHGFPCDYGREVLEPYGGFGENAFGTLAYLDGNAVSCAATFLVGERLHVGWVATNPDHQRRGYGEAAMRESMRIAAAASGFTTAALRSTKAARPLYERMGFRTVARFRTIATAKTG